MIIIIIIIVIITIIGFKKGIKVGNGPWALKRG